MDYRAEVIGIESFVIAMQRKAARTKREVAEATRTGVQVMAAAAEERVIIPTQRSGQDDKSIRGAYRYRPMARRTPVRRRVDSATAVGYVLLGGHWTSARTPGIEHVYRDLGLTSQLFRDELYIRRRLFQGGGWKRGTPKGPRLVRGLLRGDTQNVSLLENRLKIGDLPWLRKWAGDDDKGRQEQRHAVRLTDPEARRLLILQPALDENLEDIIEIYHAAAAKGLLS